MRPKTRQVIGWSTVSLLCIVCTASANDLRLVEAVRNRDAKAAQALLQEHVDVNTPQPDGATALHWASHWDDLATADLLIRAGARVDAETDYGVTPLSLACSNGNVAMIEKLLGAGANPNAALSTGGTALMTAVRTGNLDAVKALLARGADVNAKETWRGQTALMWAISEKHLAVAKALIEHGADVHARSASGFTPLLFAAREGDLDAVRMHLAAGANVNEAASDSSSPLLVATVRGHAALAHYLLSQGADPNQGDYTPLHWASGRWDTALTGEFGLVSPGGEWSALAGLEGQAKLDLIKALLAHGANPNARIMRTPPRFGAQAATGGNLVGATPFFVAAMVGDITVMRLLLEYGADPLLKTVQNTTPLMIVSGLGRTPGSSRLTESNALATAKLLVGFGTDVNTANQAGDTALHGAAEQGWSAIVQFLADNGANVNVRNEDGETPLSITQGSLRTGAFLAHKETENLLRKLGAAN